METHVRGLTSLGKSQDSYGDLLVPIILGKLPNELRRNLAREHSNPKWTFPQLTEAIYREIKILEAGNHIPADNYTSPIAKSIKNDLYVDNFISGRDTEEETLQYYNESRSIMAEGKFNLRSWASNSKALRDQATKQNGADPNEIVNLLGLKWDPTSDTLTFNQRAITPSFLHLITKREILRQLSKTFDPLGMLSPVTIKAKLFLQELWQQRVEWDEPLSHHRTQIHLGPNFISLLMQA